MRRFAALFLAVFLSVLPAQAAQMDWDAAYREVKTHLVNLVNINTAQPAGNETEAARYIYRVLSREKIDWSIFPVSPGRANLVAVLRGESREKPLLLLSHLDTVPADSAEWSVDPFKATEKDGYIYGRGALDCKSLAAIDLATMVWLKRTGVKLKRDVIMLASADEESGGAKGVRWMIDNHWDAIEAGFALNEGGGVLLDQDGQARVVFVDAGSKMYMDLQLTTRGASGHSALAPSGSAIYRLGAALGKIRAYRAPLRVSPVARKLFESIYPYQSQDAKTTIDMLFSADPAAREQAAAAIGQDPFFNSQLRDTVVPTILQAGYANNVLPGHARAVVNCRLLPDSDPDQLVADLKAAVADDKVEFSVLEKPELPYPKPMDMSDPLYASIVRVSSAVLPSAVVAGVLSPSNDSEHLRRRGTVTYGLCGPATYGKSNGVHGVDERISERELYQQFRLMYSVAEDFAAVAVPARAGR